MANAQDNTVQSPLRLVIAGGGTGGHVLPAIAVIEEIRHRNIPAEVLWIGGRSGVEAEIAASNDIPFVAIQTGKLRRYFSIRTAIDAVRIPVGITQALLALRRFSPDVIYGTGGAVSFPTVFAGARLSPILTHEQTAQIGIANKLAARFADTFATSFEQTANLARQRHKHVVVTGNPVRSSILNGSRTAGLQAYGFTDDLPVVYVTGGARGASPLNTRIESLLPRILETVQIVHQAGPASANDDVARLRAASQEWPDHLRQRYRVEPFIHEGIANVYAMADLVVARAGAGTVTELAHVGLPSILIPLPGTWGDEQRKNAAILAEAGAAITIEQDSATPERLETEILRIANDPDTRARMATAAKSIMQPGAASRLLDELLALAGRTDTR